MPQPTEEPIPEFDPDAAEEVEVIDKDPSEMTPEERGVAARHALYEARRLMVGAGAALEYLAELVGVPPEEVQSISDRAETDEFRELAMDDEEFEASGLRGRPEVAESYEAAAAAGHDPEAEADRIFNGTSPTA
jgi:hypothetical protein